MVTVRHGKLGSFVLIRINSAGQKGTDETSMSVCLSKFSYNYDLRFSTVHTIGENSYFSLHPNK